MQSNISFPWALGIVGSVTILSFFAIGSFLAVDTPVQVSFAQSVTHSSDIVLPQVIDNIPTGVVEAAAVYEQASLGFSMHLKIPKINVNAAIESVGLTSDGAVGVPKNPAHAAWFNRGPRPGEVGSAVITGHYGPWKSGAQSVFDNLYKLRIGDTLSVVNAQGVSTTFVVRAMRTYGQNDTVPGVFGTSDRQAHLNLITCAGAWNKTAQGYPNRLVVFTDKVAVP